MSTSIVDGTVEAAELKRSVRKLSVFKTLRFQLDDGSSRTIANAVVNNSVAEQLTPGNSGRFYLFSGFDLKGVHGVRKSDGTAIYEFPGTNNARLFLIMGFVNLAWIVLRLMLDGSLPFLAVGLIILSVVGYTLMSKTEREAKAQFAADGGERSAPAPLAAEPGA